MLERKTQKYSQNIGILGKKLGSEGIASKIIEYLRWHPNAKPSEIADYLGVSPRIVRAVLARLRAKGIVVRTDKGYVLKADIHKGVEAISAAVEKREEPAQKQAAQDIVSNVVAMPREALPRLDELEKRVRELEKIVYELKSAAQSNTVDKDWRKMLCQELYDSIELVKMGLEAIRLGDQHSLDSILSELENMLEKLRKCSTG